MIISEGKKAGEKASAKGDRRARSRYAIQLSLFGAVGNKFWRPFAGTTVNLSSNGILFATHEAIPVGARVRIVIDWPAPEDGGRVLAVLARVVWTEGNLVAAQIWSHQFQSSAG